MTSMASQSTTLQNNPGSPAPYSGLVRIGAGVALILAGLLNGLPPYLFSVFVGDMTFSEQIKWGATHMAAQRAEQLAVVVSTLFMPLGLLGVAQVTRWRAPRLTLFAVPFMLWGMWGFHNILSSGYVAATIAPAKLGVEQAVALNDAFLADGGLVAAALLPHLVGSFLGSSPPHRRCLAVQALLRSSLWDSDRVLSLGFPAAVRWTARTAFAAYSGLGMDGTNFGTDAWKRVARRTLTDALAGPATGAHTEAMWRDSSRVDRGAAL